MTAMIEPCNKLMQLQKLIFYRKFTILTLGMVHICEFLVAVSFILTTENMVMIQVP